MGPSVCEAVSRTLCLSPDHFLPLQRLLHLCVVIQSLPYRVDYVLLQNELTSHIFEPQNIASNLTYSTLLNDISQSNFLISRNLSKRNDLQAGEEVGQLDEERQKDKSDEACLRRRLVDFVPIHEGGDWKPL